MSPSVADAVRAQLSGRPRLPAPEERRRLRISAGMSQQTLAELVGVTPQAVSMWEHGKCTPRAAMLGRYAEALQALQEAAA